MTAVTRKNFSIAAAEDDEEDRILMREAMRNAGIEKTLTIFEKSEHLMEHLNKNKNTYRKKLPNIIILDLNMPGKNGFDCLKEIKSDPALSHIPVIVMSTSGYTADITTCYKLGANSYIRKPLTFNELVDRMKTIAHYWIDSAELPDETAHLYLQNNRKDQT
jgi:CheY-like chemotaxis protein